MTPFVHALSAWFQQHKRLLPWRDARTPYRVWVSEVMLQQTQVATVIPYFGRWLARFPDIATLAEAPQETVLKTWEGLGYYRRARLLHEGARRVVSDYGGALPNSYAELLRLPGIGPYTAGAIASLAFGESVLAVDGNIKRVAARLFRLGGEPPVRAVAAALTPHLPDETAGAFNEALMELGALICLPRSPHCDMCPVSGYCEAFGQGQVALYPEAKQKKKVPHHERYALVYRRGERLWLRRRSETEMLGGLWGFILSDAQPEGAQLEPVAHAYTHFRITATPVLFDKSPGIGEWVDEARLERLPLSRLDNKILARLHGAMLKK